VVAWAAGAAFANPEIVVDLPGGASMEFVWIEPGTFTMGTTPEQEQLLLDKKIGWGNVAPEQPAHQVTITQGFYLGKYEITQGQWAAVMGTRPWQQWQADFETKGWAEEGQTVLEGQNYAAPWINWNDAQAFVEALDAGAGSPLYRLPTEAEWEYACRAGTSTLWSFGDDEGQLDEYAWYGANTCDIGECWPHEVGTKLPNPWGLFDMHGNLTEICSHGHRKYPDAAEEDPTGPVEPPSAVVPGSWGEAKRRLRH